MTGFLLVAGAMLWCAFLQYKVSPRCSAKDAIISSRQVYKTSPCGYRATSCDVGSGVSPIVRPILSCDMAYVVADKSERMVVHPSAHHDRSKRGAGHGQRHGTCLYHVASSVRRQLLWTDELIGAAALRSMAHAVFLSTQAASSVIVLLLTPIMRDPLLVFPFLLTVGLTKPGGPDLS